MSQYDIEHRCGHSEVRDIDGTNVRGEREKYAAWLEKQDCRNCQRQARIDKEQSVVDGLGLPELTGSPKQIAWAEELRRRTVAALPVSDAAQKVLKSLTTARWWIDHRKPGGRSGEHAADAVLALLPANKADDKAAQTRTLALLHRQWPATTELQDPSFTPGRGQRRPHPLYLVPDVARAMSVWSAVMHARATDRPGRVSMAGELAELDAPPQAVDALVPQGIELGVIALWIDEHHGTTAGELVALAYEDATKRPPLGWFAIGGAEHFALARRLQERWTACQPPKPAPPAPPEETHCLHGRSFSEDCDDCEI